jgi:excisionase family DNA binding protein
MNLSFDLSEHDLDALAERLTERIRPTDEPSSDWITLEPAAEYLGRTPMALRLMARRGQVPWHQPTGPGGRIYFSKAELDAWVRGA